MAFNNNNNNDYSIKTNLCSIIENNVMLQLFQSDDKMGVRFVISKGKGNGDYYRFSDDYKLKEASTALTATNQIAFAGILEQYIFTALKDEVETDEYCIDMVNGDTSLGIRCNYADDGVLTPIIALHKKLTTDYPETYEIQLRPTVIVIRKPDDTKTHTHLYSKLRAIYNRMIKPERYDPVEEHVVKYRNKIRARYSNTSFNNVSDNTDSDELPFK